jgi:uncharacterized protein YbjT (DUF2867 family)
LNALHPDSKTILITGATGNVGRHTIKALTTFDAGPADARGPTATGGVAEIRAGVRGRGAEDRLPHGVLPVHLDFADANSFAPALAGVDRVLLVRPPLLVNVRRYFQPFIRAAEAAGVRHVVFLSVMGAENAGFIPHAGIERALVESRMAWTFLRPGFFNQNLSTTHAADIRDHDRIFVPAGGGVTAFIDTQDIGAVAARALTEPGHESATYTLTSDDLLTYEEIADILTEALDRRIAYERPGALRFIAKELREGTPATFALLMAAVYLPTRLGKAGRHTDTLRELLGRNPVSFRSFVAKHRQVWMRD